MRQGSTHKIPCSVSMLTLNAAEGLPACLESLRDFAEIIVCDANSTDNTQNIARSYGAKILKQYDTDEPAVPCAMDKAAVRERAMSASTLPWRFFMDADDTLSPQAVEEIRYITSNTNPSHLIWRMPTRIFIGDKEILHEASYPSYQTRLVHEKVDAHFKGAVHDRLVWDTKQNSVGTMNSFYNFGWSRERVKNYWSYLHTYAKRELTTTAFTSLGSYLRWGFYFRLRVLLSYIVWRIPSMYLRHGFKDSMPLAIELTIARYHWYLLVHSFLQYVATRNWFIIFIETLRGKDLNRILSNIAVSNFETYGRVLDIGGREGKSSYWRYLKHTRWFRTTTLDIDPTSKPDVLLNIEQEPLPFSPGHFDTALLFNVLEHLKNGDEVLTKIAQVLRPNGVLIGVVPFLVGVHPDPHDYVRYTNEGLEEALAKAGFSNVEVCVVGRGPLTASYYQSEFLWPRILKLVLLPFILLLDALILALKPIMASKFPLSYTFVARR